MAKVSFVLVFALLVALPFRSVLGQEWQSLLDQANAAGISQETIGKAQNALGDGSAQKAAEEVLGDAGNAKALGDLIQEAKKGSPPPPAEGNSLAEAPEDLLDDEVDDSPAEKSPAEAPKKSDQEKSPAEAPKNSPTGAPKEAPTRAPAEAPELAPKNAPTEAPSTAPEAQAPNAGTRRA